MYTVNITRFELVPGTQRELYVTWDCKLNMIYEYRLQWYRWVGFWLLDKEETAKWGQATYTAASETYAVLVKILPVSATRPVNGVETHYWYGQWREKSYMFAHEPPEAPSVPTVAIDKYNLTASIENVDDKNHLVEFQVAVNDSTIFNSGSSQIITNKASYSCPVNAGNRYKARARVKKHTLYSEWSDWSSNVGTIPSAQTKAPVCKGSSSTSVIISWDAISSAETYEIQYTENSKYFEGSDAIQSVSGIESTTYEKTGLETGKEYFFRVRATNDQGSSDWSPIGSVVIGKDPDSPTTWSSSTTAVSGETVTLYWIHNTQDGSNCTYSRLELNINGKKETFNIKNPGSTDDSDTSNKTIQYEIDTSKYQTGTKIQWRVATAGVTLAYGPFSIERVINIYAPPTLSLKIKNSQGVDITSIESLPIRVVGIAGPEGQTPIGYHLSVISNQTYDTTNEVGSYKRVNAGDAIYSKYFDINKGLDVTLSAGDIDLENTVSYTMKCIATMNSGLTTESSVNFDVSWQYDLYVPNADIGYDENTITTRIRPFCMNDTNEYVPNITLSVYRREFDGSFTLIGDNLSNGQNTFISDPHPSLDFARYRIVARSKDTGNVTYSDLPGYPVREKAVIIQWDEAWTEFEATDSGVTAIPPWSGSMLKLPYNIDVSDNANADVELVGYIGRKRPVSYYGTQLNETSTWNVEIPKKDKDTLYALRRLSIWIGDVYVREPSGSGYWANIAVSFSQTHQELTIPVTFDITRVEGGV